VKGPGIDDQNQMRTKRVMSDAVAQQATSILQSVVTYGTGRNAQIGEFAAGKTGTTENYQDAWFVGFNDLLTVAVWVGYPEGAQPMETEYHGQPVAGGTYPADIWHDFMLSVKEIRETRAIEEGKGATGATGPTGVPVTPVAPSAPAPEPTEEKPPKRKPQATPGTGGDMPDAGGQTPAPEPVPEGPPETPAQPTQPPPSGGGTGGAGGGVPGDGGGASPGGGTGQ
jgi:penicillin-binding protein 1A